MLQPLTLDEMLSYIEPAQRAPIEHIYKTYKEKIAIARGSKTKHQTWSGGYLGHLGDMGAMGVSLYNLMQQQWKRQLPFTISDVMTVILLHDIEKPFKHKKIGEEIVDSMENPEHWKKAFLQANKVLLTPQQENALEYIHGENDQYHPTKRVMNELGSFCHSLDILSARLFYNHPQSK